MAFLILFGMINIKLAVYYGIFCLILWLALSSPRYTGPSKIVKLNSTDEFLEFINKPGSTKQYQLKESVGYTLSQR